MNTNIIKVATDHFADTFNLSDLPYEVDFSKTKTIPENPHKAFLNFVDQMFGGDSKALESFIKSQKAMRNMLNELPVHFSNSISVDDIVDQEHHCFCVTFDDGKAFNISLNALGFYVTVSVDERLQKLEDAFNRDTAAIATDQLKTERKLQALEKDYKSQVKQLEQLSKQLRNLHIKNMELENRVDAGVRYLDGLTASNPRPFSSWADSPNNAFGHSPQNSGFSSWHSPARPFGMSNFDSPAPPDQSPFKGWGRSDQSAFVHPGNVPPASTIKPADLPPYPRAVVKPEDLCTCNEVVICCIGTDGNMYHLTKDTIIAHTVPWEELSPVAFNKVDWYNDKGKWGVFKESAGEDIPEGTLVYSKSVRSAGLIVRYPDKKYDFNIVNL